MEKVWPASIFSIPSGAEATVSTDGQPTWSPHINTGVNTAHELGYKGDNVIVAIVDSGVDYGHPALGGGFGPGFKVESGYDLVGDDYVLGGPYVPDNDPNDCAGHGTHVAGIIGSSYEVVLGVAPSARLRSYKVFGCGTSTYEDVIIEAFIMAYEDGADVINASLGCNQGFPDGPLAIVTSTIQAAGVFVAVAAGNAGETGMDG